MKREFIIDADNIEVVEIYTGGEYKTPKTPTNAETRIFEQWRYEMQTRYWNLPIIALPHGNWVLRDTHLARLNNTLHRAIRRFLLNTERPKCSACGFAPESPRFLAAHEVINLDMRRNIMTFVRYRLLCKDCHYLTHHGYWALGGYGYKRWKLLYQRNRVTESDMPQSALLRHYCKVNGCSQEEAYIHACGAQSALEAIYGGFDIRKGKLPKDFPPWHTDWSALEQYQGKLGSNNVTLDKMLSELKLSDMLDIGE